MNPDFLLHHPSRPLTKPSFWRMCLGKHHMNSSMDVPSAEECYKVDSIIRHKGFVYEQDRTDITNDIALVHLAERVNMTKEISPICLPKPGAVMPAGTPCFVTGWGDEKGRSDHTFPSPVKEGTVVIMQIKEPGVVLEVGAVCSPKN